MKRFFLCSLTLLLLTCLLSACSSTTLTGSWRSPDHLNATKKVYIVGVSKQETHRRIFEDEFGKELQMYGVKTVSSYRDLKNIQDTDQKEILEIVKNNGADTLLMTRILSDRTEEVVTPGRISGYSSSPVYYDRRSYNPRPYYRNYSDYYNRRYEMTYEPASVSRFKVITLESNLYDAATGELIWSAQLETVMEGTMQTMIRDFIKVVTKDLLDQGVI